MDLDFRRASGVIVVRIVRGGLNVNVPGGRERLYPHDRIVVAGSDEQIARFQEQLDAAARQGAEQVDSQAYAQRRATMSLEQLVVTADMPFCGKTLAQSRIREMAQCAVLGIERDGVTTMNPEATMTLQEGDTLILAGDVEQIQNLFPDNADPASR